MLPVDDHTRRSFEKYRAGDAAAGDDLAQSLQAANQQTAGVIRDSITRGQPNTAPLTAQPGERVGVLQTPDFLNAQLDVAETALNTEDAFQKLALEQQGVVSAAREAGLGDLFTPEYFAGRFADIQNGMSGPFTADPQAIQTRLNSAQANDPAYIRYINRLGGVTAAAEINRRQNILADAKQKIAGGARQQERLRSSDDLIRQLREMEEDRGRDTTDIAMSGADNYTAQRALDKYERDYQVKKERLENALWRSMADADPARAVAFFEGMNAPRSGNAIFGTGETITTPQPSHSKGPPTEGINLGAAYGTRNRFGELEYPGRDQGALFSNQAPQAPQPAAQPPKPAEPPPPGKDWRFEGGRWVLKDIEEYQPVPRFAEGTGDYYYGQEAYDAAGAAEAASPPAAPPAAGAMTSSAPAGPPSPSTEVPMGGGVPGDPLGTPGYKLGDQGIPSDLPPEYWAIMGQIQQIRTQAATEQQEFALQVRQMQHQFALAEQERLRQLMELGQRATSAMTAIQQRYMQIESMIKEAAANNPYVMRRIARIPKPEMTPPKLPSSAELRGEASPDARMGQVNAAMAAAGAGF